MDIVNVFWQQGNAREGNNHIPLPPKKIKDKKTALLLKFFNYKIQFLL